MTKQRTLDLQPQSIAADLAEPIVSRSIYPAAPDPEVIRWIYRKGDGIVNIVRRRKPTDKQTGSDMYLLAAIDAQMLPGFFEQEVALAECDEEAFFQVNAAGSVYKQLNEHGIVDHRGELLHKPNTKAPAVVAYNAVWVDLDVYNIGLRYSDVVWLALRAAEEGMLPQFSLSIDSGRGCWLMWLLHGSSPDLPAPRDPVNEKLWRATMGELGRLFASLAVDPKAKNMNRVCRIHGSLHRKSNRRVGAMPWIDRDTGKILTYGLPDLAEQFGIDLHRIPPIEVVPTVTNQVLEVWEPYRLVQSSTNARKDVDPIKRKAGIVGHRAKWNALKQNIYRLIQFRRKIRVGQREATIFILAMIIEKLNRKHDNPEQDAVEEIARNLLHLFEQPPGDEITLTKIETITRSAYRNARSRSKEQPPIGEKYIAEVLEITAAEEQALDGALPRAGTQRPNERDEQKKRAGDRRERRAKQQAIVTAMVKANYEKSGRVPTVAYIQANLFAEGLKEGASYRMCHGMQQVALAELGIAGRKRTTRPKPATGPTLF